MNEKIKSPSGQGGGGSSSTGGGNNPSSSVSAASIPQSSSAGPTPPTSAPPTPNNGSNDILQAPPPHSHHYGAPLPHHAGAGSGPDPAVMSHYSHPHMHPQQPPPPHMQHQPSPSPQQSGQGPLPPQQQQSNEHQANPKEVDYSHLPPPPGGHHPPYGRYHADPNMDPYRYAPMQQPPQGGKPPTQQQMQGGPSGAGTIGSPGRPPPQRYIPGQPPQGPTPTLNSLLQSSHPHPPPQHRYTNSYDPQQAAAVAAAAAAHQQNAQQPGAPPPPPGPHGHGPPPPGPPPPQHQPPYGAQQGGWAPPRPYSPQLGPSQQYRTPPPTNTSRGHSPYPQAHGQNSGSYPSSPQQQQQAQQQQQQQSNVGSGAPGSSGGGGPPPPQNPQQNTPPPTSQYSPYPQRYPTPPGIPAAGPNHRSGYSTHQYTESNRPWPGGSSPAPSPGSGGHPVPSASPHHASQQPQQLPLPLHSNASGPPPSNSPGHAPSPSPQPSQASPSPHQELMGQNSNDSSSGGAHSGLGSGPPGTPNSQQVMRPTPSPTGSTGSRSMSPAVAQNHPISRPASNQSSAGSLPQPPVIAGPLPLPSHGMPGAPSLQQSQPQASNSASSASNSPQQTSPAGQQPPPPNLSLNNMGTPQGPGGPNSYPLPPHMHGGYKLGTPGQSPGPQSYAPQPPQQYPQGNYSPRPQYPPAGYPTNGPPPTSQTTAASNMPPSPGPQQYPGRPMPNHTGGPPHAQYPPYQSWVPPSPQGPGGAPVASPMSNHVQGKGTPPPIGPTPPQGSGSPRPLNYLKQHLQHKGGYGGSPTLPQGYGNGTGMHPVMPMGPPNHMGPPHGPTTMGPPTSTPPQSITGGPEGSGPEHISQDNGISSSGSSATSGPHLVTSVVTTGPDGTPMDEVSQQSTLSNASAASGEDPQCTTPKSRKNDPYSQSHLAPPSTSPGGPHPGVQSGGPPGEEYDMNSPPNWSRPPASPQVFNSHVSSQEPFRSTITTTKKSDSLCKLYEMDENPERRGWLDKLRTFMEDRRTPITACPTISKQPLDLYRLYIYVKERGGFVEVTKSKTWKDIAGLLGIGASSSAAYTLRKHYTKNLLAFECHFDRGDIDPLPIIQQVEAGSKKKTTKAASVPSPVGGHLVDAATTNSTGSSNSQDSFPAPPGAPPNASIVDGSSNVSGSVVGGYPGYPPAGSYPGTGAPQPDYGAAGQMQRPPSQNNAQTPHTMITATSSTTTTTSTKTTTLSSSALSDTQSKNQATPGDNISVNNPFDDPVAASGGTSVAGVSASAAAGVGYPQSIVIVDGRLSLPPPGLQMQAQQISSGVQQTHQQQQQPLQPPPHVRSNATPYLQQQTNSYPTPVSRTPGAPYPGQPGAYGQYGSGDQYNATGPPGQPFGQNQGQYPQNRNMYPPYGPEGEAPPSGANQYGPYGNRPYSQTPSGGPQPNTQTVTPSPGGPPTSGAPGAPPTGAYVPTTPNQQDYYSRPPDQNSQPRRHPDFVKDPQPYPGYNARPQLYGPWQGGSNQYRPQYPSTPSPQQWGGAPPRTQAPPGGPHSGSPNQQTSAPAQWEQHRYPPQQAPLPQSQPSSYGQSSGQQPQPQQPQAPPQWAQMTATQPPPQPGSPVAQLRPPINAAPQQQQRMPLAGTGVSPGMPPQQQQQQQPQQQPPTQPLGQTIGMPPAGSMSKPPFSMPPPPQNVTVMGASVGQTAGSSGPGLPTGIMPQKQPMLSGSPTQTPAGSAPQQGPFPQPGNTQLVKKEIIFPPDSVEATTPVLYRRKRLTKADVCPIDPWRIFMAMRSGLLTECTWALDVLNVLLFDDTTVQYFGLSHLPGLLTLLLEHFQKNLAEMFVERDDDMEMLSTGAIGMDDDEDDADSGTVQPTTSIRDIKRAVRRKRVVETQSNDVKPVTYDSDADEGIDLGQIRVKINPEERMQLLTQTPNYTQVSRKGVPVRIQPADNEIFIDKRRKSWDVDTNKLYEQEEPIGSNAWTYGFTEPDVLCGIIDVFKSEFVNIPFARYVRSKNDNNDKKLQIDEEKTSTTTAVEGNKNFAEYDVSEAKKSKLSDVDVDSVRFAQPTEVKKESNSDSIQAVDSDCREVDMEIESSQQQQQRLTNCDDSTSKSSTCFDPKSTVRDQSSILKRRRDSTYEDECYTRDEASLYLVNESQDSLARRCIAISNIFRNLTFVPGNETVLAKSTRFLALLGRLLLLNHEHLQRTPKTRNYDREEDTDFSDSCSSLQGECEWWWDYLIVIRENMLVAIANIAGHLELARFDELIARPLIDGLLHWAVCPSAHAQDPFPSVGPNTALSPQRLALEALCKLCVTDANVDLVIATPPFSRLEKLCAVLTRHLCRNEDQVLREFSVNLLHYLAAADSAMARTVALQSPCISYLVAFIEQAEQTALGVANQHGINYLRENPDSMGTSLDMLRRAAGTLLHLAKHPDNRSLFMQQEQRMLGLVMSHILDQQVALIISRVLFQVSRGHPGPMHSSNSSNEHRFQHQRHNSSTNIVPSIGTIRKNDKKGSALIKAEIKQESVASTAVEVISNSNIIYTNSRSLSHIANQPASIIAAAADENSNSSNQQLPPAATFNDVSNSSTNSNSCSTASSNLSNSSSVGSNSHMTVNANNVSTSSTTAEHSSSSSGEQQNHQAHLLSGGSGVSIGSKSTLSSSLNNSNISLNTTTTSNTSAPVATSAPPPPATNTTTAVA